jgi:PAS domain-containing protein
MEIWFSAVRQRVEHSLRQSHDQLLREAAIRNQQAELLNLTHDPIFVRNMDGVITYWKRRGTNRISGRSRIFGNSI